MTLEHAISSLRLKFGSHRKVASELGLSCEHYSALRHGRVKLPQKTANLIILKAKQEESQPMSAKQDDYLSANE